MRHSTLTRYLGLLLMTSILLLNVYIFLTLPSSQHDDVHLRLAGDPPKRYDSNGVSHLQFPRKRLNKSNFTSGSFGADGRGEGVKGGSWDDQPVLRDNRDRKHNLKDRKTPVDKDVLDPDPEDSLSRPSDDHGAKSDKARAESGTVVSNNLTDPRVDELVGMLRAQDLLDEVAGQGLHQENYWMFLKRQRLRRRAGTTLSAFRNYKATTNWEHFHKGIRQHYLYDPDSRAINNLLKDLAGSEIVDVEQKDGGTQIKLIMTFSDEGQALFKPMRFPRDVKTLPDHFYFADYERHISEIAAFHLDRLLGFNRVPPVAGRLVNITQEIREFADKPLLRTFFISPAGNVCFHGSCSYYCDSGHPICGHPVFLEGSLMAFLPSEMLADRQTWRNPWKRSYSKHRKAYWEIYDDLCHKVRTRPPYNSGRRLLDLMDMAILDFLMGNLDRHHYETFREFGNDSAIIHLDHGRGFGKPHEDDLSCLAPVLQCCLVRLSTVQRLVRLYAGPYPLSTIMTVSLSTDNLPDVLIQPHLLALDRRLLVVLTTLRDCVQAKSLKEVVVDDGVY